MTRFNERTEADWAKGLIGIPELTANNYSPLGNDLMNGAIVQKSTVFVIDGPKPQSLGV